MADIYLMELDTGKSKGRSGKGTKGSVFGGYIPSLCFGVMTYGASECGCTELANVGWLVTAGTLVLALLNNYFIGKRRN